MSSPDNNNSNRCRHLGEGEESLGPRENHINEENNGNLPPPEAISLPPNIALPPGHNSDLISSTRPPSFARARFTFRRRRLVEEQAATSAEEERRPCPRFIRPQDWREILAGRNNTRHSTEPMPSQSPLTIPPPRPETTSPPPRAETTGLGSNNTTAVTVAADANDTFWGQHWSELNNNNGGGLGSHSGNEESADTRGGAFAETNQDLVEAAREAEESGVGGNVISNNTNITSGNVGGEDEASQATAASSVQWKPEAGRTEEYYELCAVLHGLEKVIEDLAERHCDAAEQVKISELMDGLKDKVGKSYIEELKKNATLAQPERDKCAVILDKAMDPFLVKLHSILDKESKRVSETIRKGYEQLMASQEKKAIAEQKADRYKEELAHKEHIIMGMVDLLLGDDSEMQVAARKALDSVEDGSLEAFKQRVAKLDMEKMEGVKAMQEDLVACNAIIEDLDKASKEKDEQIETLTAENKTLVEDIARMEKNLKVKDETIEAVVSANVSLRYDNKTLSSNNDFLLHRLQTLEAENAMLKAQQQEG